MAKTDYQSVDGYISAQPEAVRPVLEQVRGIIGGALPVDAREVISYDNPDFRLRGGADVWFAGWAKHYSVYPATPGVVAAFERELEPYERSKGTIRFPLSGPVPADLIARIAKLRADEVVEAGKAKAAKSKKAAAK
jgi:uncharacterized protein YdhG (YjbR/CyaY superfamily)